MNRPPDRLCHPAVVVLCVRVTCTLAENDVAGAPLRDLGKSRREPARVQHGPVSLRATHVRAACTKAGKSLLNDNA